MKKNPLKESPIKAEITVDLMKSIIRDAEAYKKILDSVEETETQMIAEEGGNNE